MQYANIFGIIVAFYCTFFVIREFYFMHKRKFENSVKGREKRYFNKRLNDILISSWDAEFTLKENKLIREGIRNEYDRIKEMQDACKVKIEAENKKENPDKTIIKQMQDLSDKFKPDTEKMEKQMNDLDNLMFGGKDGCMKNMDGTTSGRPSLQKHIEDCRPVIEMLQSKVNKL